MFILVLVLHILAAFCFVLCIAGVGGKWNLLALGWFLWALVPISQLINSKMS
jgi:hypothetical protein